MKRRQNVTNTGACTGAFEQALHELQHAHEGDGRASLCRPFLRVVPVSGAALSTIGSGLGMATICASDERAARIDELQIDLGEGPCWEALATGRPVIRNRFSVSEQTSWPVFAKALRDYEIGALYAFPLAIGTLEVGSVDLYSETPRELTSSEISNVTALTHAAAWQVLRRVLADDSQNDLDIDADPSPGYSRKQVHQATGMIIAQLQVSSAEALLLLRAHSFSSGRTVREVAHDIVSRKLDLSVENERS
jgi:hypothetical protein